MGLLFSKKEPPSLVAVSLLFNWTVQIPIRPSLIPSPLLGSLYQIKETLWSISPVIVLLLRSPMITIMAQLQAAPNQKPLPQPIMEPISIFLASKSGRNDRSRRVMIIKFREGLRH